MIGELRLRVGTRTSRFALRRTLLRNLGWLRRCEPSKIDEAL